MTRLELLREFAQYAGVEDVLEEFLSMHPALCIPPASEDPLRRANRERMNAEPSTLPSPPSDPDPLDF